MQTLIALRQKKNANRYKVIYGKGGVFKQGSIIKGYSRKKLTDNRDDLVYQIKINDKDYVVKQINSNDEDEWDCVTKILTGNLICPNIIEYYACIKSMSNHKRYILMRKANMDLKDFIRNEYITVDKKLLIRFINFALDIQKWFKNNLKVAYNDLKCRNILVCYNDNDYINFQLKLTDIGLIEDIDQKYKLDKKMLQKTTIVNFMYPRRECSYEQCALFTVAMFILEVLTVNLNVDENLDFPPSNRGTREKEGGKDDIVKKIEDVNINDKDEENEKDEKDEKDEKENDGKSDSGSDGESDDESGGENESDDEFTESVAGLLDGRENDEKIKPILYHLKFFREEKCEIILSFLEKLIDFHYQTIEEAINDFASICSS